MPFGVDEVCAAFSVGDFTAATSSIMPVFCQQSIPEVNLAAVA